MAQSHPPIRIPPEEQERILRRLVRRNRVEVAGTLATSRTPVGSAGSSRTRTGSSHSRQASRAAAEALPAAASAPPAAPRPLWRRAGYVASLAGGLAAGLTLVLPVQLPAPNECPAAGEGLVTCQLTKAWLPAVTEVALIMCAFLIVAWALLDWIPAARARRSSGERLRFRPVHGTPVGERPRAPHPLPSLVDSQLAAASWGRVGAPPPGRRPPAG